MDVLHVAAIRASSGCRDVWREIWASAALCTRKGKTSPSQVLRSIIQGVGGGEFCRLEEVKAYRVLVRHNSIGKRKALSFCLACGEGALVSAAADGNAAAATTDAIYLSINNSGNGHRSKRRRPSSSSSRSNAGDNADDAGFHYYIMILSFARGFKRALFSHRLGFLRAGPELVVVQCCMRLSIVRDL